MIKRRDRQKSLCDDISIKLKRNFSRSTNLKIDYEDNNSLKHLIISDKFQRNFVNICGPMVDNNSNQRVHVVSGTPGVGKSTFAVFAAKYSSKRKNKHLSSLIDVQSKDQTPEFKKIISKISSKNFLPVFLNGDEGEIEDAFFEALSTAFTDNNMIDEFSKLEQQNSTRAFEIINTWKKNYPLKFDEFKIYIERENEEGYDGFIKSLKRNRRNAQKFFSKAYRQITGGASIGSYRHGQVVDLYKSAVKVLKNKNYSGLFIVYDEFGKYLERGVRDPNNFDLQFLQDIVEFCNKGSDLHSHLLLIAHLPISQYASQLPISIQQEWAKIEGRFQQSSFNSGYESSYSILGSVFETNLRDQDKSLFRKVDKMTKEWIKTNQECSNFSELFRTKDIDNEIKKSYPLHPSTFSLLPLLSEKVAQNERTMFSFLTRDEEFSLPWFLKRNIITTDELIYLRPIHLFGYFKNLISNDIGIGGACKTGLIIEGTLNALESDQECEKDVVALLGITSIINNKSILKVSYEAAKAILNGLYSDSQIKVAFENLEANKNVIFDRLRNEFVLFEGSPIDLREEINKVRQSKLTNSGYIKILRNNFDLNFILPKKYNFKNGITRYFKEFIISYEELKEGLYEVNYSTEDGRVYYVVPFSHGEIKKIKQFLSENSFDSSIFMVANNPLEIEPELLELYAIDQIFSKKEILSAGSKVQKELMHYKDASVEIIKKRLRKIRSNIYMDSSLIYRNEIKNEKVTKLIEVVNFASEVCEKEYSKHPVFHNEMISKHRASVPIIQGRIKLINAFDFCHLKRYGIEGGGPEFSLYKALLKANSFIFTTGSDGLKSISGLRKNSALFPLFEDFKKFLKESEKNPIIMLNLVERWRRPPFGVRTPLIPIYVNLFFRMVQSPVSIFHDGIFVGRVDTELFENLIKQPKKYSLRMIHIDSKKKKYLDSLSKLFSTFIPGESSKKDVNFADVARIISKYYSLVPSYTRRHPSLTITQKQLVSQLNVFRQPEQFILNDLPNIYTNKQFNKLENTETVNFIEKLETDLSVIFKKYIKLIASIAGVQKNYLLKLRNITNCKKFKSVDKGAPLAKFWKDVFMSLSDDVLVFPYSEKTLMLVNRVHQLGENPNNQSVVETIADALTGSSPRSWNEKGETLFELNLRKAVTEIEQINYLKSRDNSKLVTIASFNSSGKPIVNEILKADFNKIKNEAVLVEIKRKLKDLEILEINALLLNLLGQINLENYQTTRVSNDSTIGKAWG